LLFRSRELLCPAGIPTAGNKNAPVNIKTEESLGNDNHKRSEIRATEHISTVRSGSRLSFPLIFPCALKLTSASLKG
jgi:hypothetical protein